MMVSIGILVGTVARGQPTHDQLTVRHNERQLLTTTCTGTATAVLQLKGRSVKLLYESQSLDCTVVSQHEVVSKSSEFLGHPIKK